MWTPRCVASIRSPSKSMGCERNWWRSHVASPAVRRCRPATTGWGGCARRSSGPRSATRASSAVPTRWCASPDSTSPCTPPTPNAHRGVCPGRAHRSCGGRRSRPPDAPLAEDRPTTSTTTRWAAKLDGKRPALSVERKLLRRCHTLRELGDAAVAPVTERRPRDMTWRSCPALDSPDACGQLPHPPVATPRRVDVPERTSDRNLSRPVRRAHPIHHHVPEAVRGSR